MRNLTVADLIELLQDADPEMEVRFTYDYGDHWRTPVAAAIKSVDDGVVTFSEYHRMDKVVDQDKHDEEIQEATTAGDKEALEEIEKSVKKVLILS